ncbi:MAG: polyprenyl synthetase family protein [Gammaproteobacteria bacterium]
MSWAYFNAYQQRVNSILDQLLSPNAHLPQRLQTAMRYAVLSGGKRLRPLLVYLVGESVGAEPAVLDAPAAAVELIHAYSLVHDDLPAMDDDDLRRGQPTCHKAFDEATAILVGDALQALAFETLANASLSAEQCLRMLQILTQASGVKGMVGGQALDLESSPTADLEKVYQLKTGALISASIQLGVLASQTTDKTLLQQATTYGHALGLAFQIQDDILDIEGDLSTLGKYPGSDLKQAKMTYPYREGIAVAKAKVAALRIQALEALSGWVNQTNPLWSLTKVILPPL